MHEVFFGVKRVHLEVVHRVARRVLQGSGLTAARFDLMRVVHASPGIAQGKLWWLLGVAAPTVSRMLKALEGLGFVVRARETRDRRMLFVRVTAAGRKAVEAALDQAVRNREAERVVARCAVGDLGNAKRRSVEETHAFIDAAASRVAALAQGMRTMRSALFDRAPYPYPWPVVAAAAAPAAAAPAAVESTSEELVLYTDEEMLSADWSTAEEWFTR